MRIDVHLSENETPTTAEREFLSSLGSLLIERIAREEQQAALRCGLTYPFPTIYELSGRYRLGCGGLLWHFRPSTESEAFDMWDRWRCGGNDIWDHLPGGADFAYPSSLVPFMWATPQQLAELWAAAEDYWHAVLDTAPWLYTERRADDLLAAVKLAVTLSPETEQLFERWAEAAGGLCKVGLQRDALQFLATNAFNSVGYQRGVCPPPRAHWETN